MINIGVPGCTASRSYSNLIAFLINGDPGTYFIHYIFSRAFRVPIG